MEVMLPVITMRHYTKFVVDYLAALLAAHNITPATQINKPVMDVSNFLTLQDTVFVVSAGMHKDQAKALLALYPSIKAIALAGCKNHEILPALLPRLEHMASPQQVHRLLLVPLLLPLPQVLDTLEALTSCLVASPAAVVHWHKAYTSHLGPSGQLLSYIGKLHFNVIFSFMMFSSKLYLH